jgi:tRNA threonylcarbamoyladenosine biosynthesis protein TsaB
MILLALDTSSAAGSAAIVRDGALVIERDGDGSRTHGQRLPLELMALLDDASLALADIDGFAVVTGPGSFTGLRVGIATIQGLALARHKRVAPVSSFEALAFQTARAADPSAPHHDAQSSRLIATWIDAHRGEVFASLYTPDGQTIVEPPTSLSPEATLETWDRTVEATAHIRFGGDGAVRYADVIRARRGERTAILERAPALAGAAAIIAAANWQRAVSPHALVPLYVRRSDAELARERRQTVKP